MKDKRTNKKILVILYCAAIFIAYWIWVFFSYLLIPFDFAKYNIEMKQWPHNGYYKVKPGKYENKRFNTYFTINSRGFRSVEFSEEHRNDFRVIAIGASSTMGLESNDWETWPSRLQYYLAEDSYDVEVINCGIGGSCSSNHLAMLVNELTAYRPDWMVYYSGRNDHATNSLERYPGPKLHREGAWHFFKLWCIYKKIQLRLILLKLFNFDIESLLPYPNNWMKTYRTNLEAMVQEAKQEGISFVIVTQMMDYPLDILKTLAKNTERLIDVQRKIEFKNKYWHLFLRQLDVLKIQFDIARKYKLRIVDLHKAFYDSKRKGTNLFYDNVHLTPDGNDLIARSIASYLREYAVFKK